MLGNVSKHQECINLEQMDFYFQPQDQIDELSFQFSVVSCVFFLLISAPFKKYHPYQAAVVTL